MRGASALGVLRRTVGRCSSLVTSTAANRCFATSRSFSSANAARGSSPSVFAAAGSALGVGLLWAATMQPALAEEEAKGKKGKDDKGGAKDEITEAYENRIRAFSAPEKVFGLFASVTKDGEAQMNPEDFLRALHPTRSKDAPSKRRLAAAKRLFQLVDLNGDGLISYHEYIFFMTMLSLPASRFKIAFEMFDIDGNGTLDQKEFASMIEVLKSKSSMGKSSKSDVVSSSNKVKGAKTKAAQSEKGKYPVLFGAHGTKTLTFSRFSGFLENLQADLVTLEFESFGPDKDGSISAADFATSLIAHVYPKQTKTYMKRIGALDSDIRVSYQDFLAFEKMLSQLDDIEVAINTFSAANGGFGKEHLLHAAKVVAGVKLEPALVDIIFDIFDDDKSGTLENEEFISVMGVRRFHGASRRRNVDVGAFVGCCRTCYTDNLTLS